MENNVFRGRRLVRVSKARKTIMVMALAAAPLVFGGAGAAAAADDKKEVAAPEFEYLEMVPLVVPVVTERGLTQQVSIAVSLELPYGKKEEVSTYSPRLRDAYLRDLYGALGAGQVMMRGNTLDVETLKTRLTLITRRVLGSEAVREVLLQAVQQRPMQQL